MSEPIQPKTTARPTRSFYDLGNHIIVKPYSSMVRVSVTSQESGECVIIQCAFDQWTHEYIPSSDMYEALPIAGHTMLMDCGDGTKTGTDVELQRMAEAKGPKTGMLCNTARYYLALEMDLTACQ
jgi:hypothetical protein